MKITGLYWRKCSKLLMERSLKLLTKLRNTRNYQDVKLENWLKSEESRRRSGSSYPVIRTAGLVGYFSWSLVSLKVSNEVEAIDVALLLILLDTAVVLNFSKMSFELPSPAIYFLCFARYFPSFLRASSRSSSGADSCAFFSCTSERAVLRSMSLNRQPPKRWSSVAAESYPDLNRISC